MSDMELSEGLAVRAKTVEKILKCVWMKRVTEEEPPGSPMFFFTLEKESYCVFQLSVPEDQQDNPDNFTVAGSLALTSNEGKIGDFAIDLQRQPTKVTKFQGHFKPNIKYTLHTTVTSEAKRDIIFELSMTSLINAGAEFYDGYLNHLYKFRTLDDLKPRPLSAEPLPWAGSFASTNGEWTLDNSGGPNHFFDDYPQCLVIFSPGRNKQTKGTLRITLEHQDKLNRKQPSQLFYVYDLDNYIRAHKSTHRLADLLKHKFSLKDNENTDKWPRLVRAQPSRDLYFIEETIEVECNWDLTLDKYLLVVLASLQQREGGFRVTAQCTDLPTALGRNVEVRALADKWFEHHQGFRSSWVGVGGGDIGGDLFSYNPCFEIKIMVPDTQLVCKMEPEGNQEDESIRVAMYLFEPDNEEDIMFLSRNLKFKCEWANMSRVLLSATLSPEIVDNQPLISTYYIVCSTYEEGCNMNFDLKISSSRPIMVRQVN
jgi:hypothetical protein